MDIWASFRAMPVWVQVWAAFILFPANLGGLLFLETPEGRIAATLGIAGLLPNLAIIWLQRGFSNMMAFPHLVPWAILVGWIVWLLATGQTEGNLRTFLVTLMALDLVSLAFDYRDALNWLRGQRAVTRPVSAYK